MEVKNALGTTHAAVHKVLDEDHYAAWSVRVKTYLMAHDLWEIIESTTERPRKEDDEAAFKAWSMKNSMALHVIQISCGPNTFSDIIDISSAKTAWDTLEEKYNVPKNTNSGGNMNDDYVHEYEVLKKVVQSGDWNVAKEFLESHPDARVAKITILGQTALHVAVTAGREDIVEKLVDFMSEEDLAIQNSYGHTALVDAINKANFLMAESMLRKNNNLLSIKDSNGKIPVIHFVGRIELARYLYDRTPLEDLMQENWINGATLCGEAIRTRNIDIALDLIQRFPHLALAQDDEGRSPLYALASTPSAFSSANLPVFWKQWIYSCIRVQSTRATQEIRLNIQNVEERQSNQVKIIERGIKDLYEMKLLHGQCQELLTSMCEEISRSNIEQRKKGRVNDAIFQAIKEGNFEFVFHIVKADPDLLWIVDEDCRNIFFVAVLHRQPQIFSLIYGLGDEKSVLTNGQDKYGNQILHMAGMSAASIQFKRIPVAPLHMQRELQWFKEVEKIVEPKVREAINRDRLTPKQLFTEQHKGIMEAGEKWMKDIAQSCTIVAGLMITIMFAVAFTVPGGNKQETGFPVFLNQKLFILFIVSDALSHLSSISWVFLFLGILTSSYVEEDFLESSPKKIIMGLSTICFSVITMVIAFFSAILIMLQGKSWVAILILYLAPVPYAIYILVLFPLLINMYTSTYGPGIFDRKMKRWV